MSTVRAGAVISTAGAWLEIRQVVVRLHLDDRVQVMHIRVIADNIHEAVQREACRRQDALSFSRKLGLLTESHRQLSR